MKLTPSEMLEGTVNAPRPGQPPYAPVQAPPSEGTAPSPDETPADPQPSAQKRMAVVRAAMARTKAQMRRKAVRRPRKDEPPLELIGRGAPLPNPSTQDIGLARNWVDEQGGLPPYIKRISKHLEAKGMDKGRAIATAVNAAKKMCASGDLNWPGIQQVNPGSKAEACAAVERWEAMKAAARAS